MDVTPRPADEAPRPARRKRKSPAMWGVLVLIVLAIGFVLFQGLNNAALYYRNADEAVRDKVSLGTGRFRIQGTVQAGLAKNGDEVDFKIRVPDNDTGTVVDVRHRGDPPELFQVGVPVVLEGHWSQDATYFASDRILVKHSEDYKASNPDHVSSNAP